MNHRWMSRAALLIVVVGLGGCGREAPEARIQRAFDACVKGVEAKDPGAVLEHLAPRFSGPEGMDKDQAKLALLGYLRTQKIGLTVLGSRIEVKGFRAEQAVDLFITGRGEGAVLPDDSTRRSFLLTWELLEGEWKLRDLKEIRA